MKLLFCCLYPMNENEMNNPQKNAPNGDDIIINIFDNNFIEELSSMCNVAVQSCLKRDIIEHFIKTSSKISQLYEENVVSLSM